MQVFAESVLAVSRRELRTDLEERGSAGEDVGAELAEVEARLADVAAQGRALRAEHPHLFGDIKVADEVVDRGIAALERAEAPLFLFLHLFDVHDPYVSPAPFGTRFDPRYEGPIDGRRVTASNSPVRPGMDPRDLENLVARYDGGIAWVDSQIGRLLERLDELGLAEPTTWEELVAALDAIQEAGYVAVAHGGQAWQDATIFDAVVVSTQHSASATQDQVRDIVRGVVSDVLPEGWMPGEDSFYCNPTGQFIIGGPDGDAGLTGRKIIVDTYGGAAPHGGGAFSGKDPTKVDRSAAYAARYLAKNVVAAGLAERCTIQLSYAIGVAQPLSIFVNTDGTGTVDDARIGEVVGRVMDLRPKGIRTHLGLNRPIYERTAAYGHFGRTPDDAGGFSWERTDLIDAIKAELS